MDIIVEKMIIPAGDHLWLGETTVDEYVANYVCDGCHAAMVPISKIHNKHGEVGLETGFCPKCGYTKRTRNLSSESVSRHFSKKWLVKRDEEIRAVDHVFSKIRKYIPSQGRVLDVGCGLGGALLPFKNAGYDVFGVEPSEHRANLGRKLMDGIQVGFAEDYLKDPGVGKFDLIYFYNVLQFLENPFEVLKLAADKLTDNGLLYFRLGAFSKNSDYCQFSHLSLLRSFLSINSILDKLEDWGVNIAYYNDAPLEVILSKKPSQFRADVRSASALSLIEIEAYAKHTLNYARLRFLGRTNLNYHGRKTSLMLRGAIGEILPVCFYHEKDKVPVLFK